MQQDLSLKKQQVFWETPRNLAIILGTVVAVVGAASGWFGFHIGKDLGLQAAGPPQQVILLPPGSTITTPPAH